MVDNTSGEMPTTEPKVIEPLTDTPKEPTAAKTETALTPEQFKKQEEELEKTRKALKDANREAAERRKRLEELEKAESDRKAAEMTDLEKREARIKELETEKAQLETRQRENDRRELQRKVAKQVSLPEGLAERLRGDTEEDMTADAKAILELLPKQEATNDKSKLTPRIEPTNPGDGFRGETAEQKRARLLGRNVNVWDPELARQQGGGASFVEKGS